ncbi:hypothetical protein EDD21DRAFT_369064 [Dissophora ornata]|nr:hypothetical protein BGZ58_009250 [Dissophora ornata]KAI8603442.1 hypothetical protein EDD21DRAFT_369064 [Dissophora ornata]
MRFSVVALAASFIGAAMAQSCYITGPVNKTVWKAGQNYTVSWRTNPPVTAKSFNIELYKGDPAHMTHVMQLGQAKPSALHITVKVPANLTADWYAIQIGGDAYSHYFAIDDLKGTTPTGVEPTAVAVTTTASTTTAVTTTTVSTTATATPTNVSKSNVGNQLSTGPMALTAAAIVAAAVFAF